MKITNFKIGNLKTTKNLYFFDNCLVEYFEGITFNLYGSIDIEFTDGEISLSEAVITIVKDAEGKRISLSNSIKYDIENAIQNHLEKLPIGNLVY